MKIWRCTVCGWLHEGEFPPERCPRCGAPAEKFELVDPSEYEGFEDEEVAVAAVAVETVEEKKIREEERKKSAEKSLFKISYGLYVVGSKMGDRVNAQICNTVFQLTSAPMRIALGINKKNLTNEYIKSSGVLSVCVLGKEGHDMVKKFGFKSGRDVDKFQGVKYREGSLGVPIIEDCIAYFECRVIPEMVMEVGTHTLFVAEVVEGEVLRDEDPMTYALYRSFKSGKSN
ncbi:MAG: flavin reductase [Bacillota bacterium]